MRVARADPFHQVLADVRSNMPDLRVAGLDDGRYPMSLRAVDANGLEGRDVRGTLNLKARPEPPLPRALAPRAPITGTQVNFTCAASSRGWWCRRGWPVRVTT